MNNFAELSGCVFSWIEEQCKPGELQELMGAILRQVKTSRQYWRSVTFGAYPDPRIRTPQTNPFFHNLKDAKQLIFFIFFSYNLPAGTLSLDLKMVLKFYYASIISVRSTPLSWLYEFKGRIQIQSQIRTSV
jgi:hypothetical protein